MTAPVIFDPYSLPSDDNVNKYTFCVELKSSQWFLQKGKMIAYYGRIEFNGIGHGRLDRLPAHELPLPLHAADWVVADGSGKMLLADRAFDVNSYDLDDGNLTIRSGNLLAYQPSLALKQSIVPGFLTLIGTGKFVAASNGPGRLHGAADPGGPAGAGRLGGLPIALPPLRPRVHDGRPGRNPVTDRARRHLRRGAPVRVRGGRYGTVAVHRGTHGGAGDRAGRRGAGRARAAARAGTGRGAAGPRLPGQLGDLQRRFGL